MPYRNARKIKDYIVRSNLYAVQRSVGCRGCGGLQPWSQYFETFDHGHNILRLSDVLPNVVFNASEKRRDC